MTDKAVIAPGAVIGILGGGQLGRMLAMAAVALGYRVRIYAPEDAPVAADVAHFIRGEYLDRPALAAFAAGCDVLTYEFENVPAEAVGFLSTLLPVHPGSAPLKVAQDRLHEKQFVADLGGRTAPFRAVDSLADLERALAELGTPAILKTRRFGYDGKGQVRIARAGEAAKAFATLSGHALILEGFVSFKSEFSILVARWSNGETRHYPPCQNRHEEGILAETLLPAAGLDPAHTNEAIELALSIAERLQYVGVMACEFFDCADGPRFNEMAPRVHNSGHWTIEGSETSQFEQHIRAICGLPAGPTGLTAAKVRMENLLGNDVDRFETILADPTAHLHLYGKREALSGRKMGHVTYLTR